MTILIVGIVIGAIIGMALLRDTELHSLPPSKPTDVSHRPAIEGYCLDCAEVDVTGLRWKRDGRVAVTRALRCAVCDSTAVDLTYTPRIEPTRTTARLRLEFERVEAEAATKALASEKKQRHEDIAASVRAKFTSAKPGIH